MDSHILYGTSSKNTVQPHNPDKNSGSSEFEVQLSGHNKSKATIEETNKASSKFLEKRETRKEEEEEKKYEADLIHKPIHKPVSDTTSLVRKEIGQEFLRQAKAESMKMDIGLSEKTITENQYLCIDPKTGTGEPYIHKRDEKYLKVLDDPKQEIHTLLPGYATGDRYSLIFAALMEPRLHISIAYTEGNQHEENCAKEASRIIEDALRVNGEKDPSSRISLLSYSNENKESKLDLKGARESLDSHETRSNFKRESGAESPLSDKSKSNHHLFHISVTTELIARHFRNENGFPTSKIEKHKMIQDQMRKLVSEEDQKIIKKLVDDVIEEQGIQKDSVGLWIADRDFSDERQTEAIARPAMFELIADALKSKGTPVYFIADNYIKHEKNFAGKEVVINRHPYRPSTSAEVGRFWQKKSEEKPILAPRENQWYFMDQLLTKTSGNLIGIRSGALEPFALMGHNITYLEHKNMFTPERHASWQNVIPYHRLMIENTTGYLKKETEFMRSQLTSDLISKNSQQKITAGLLPSSGSNEAISLETLHKFFEKAHGSESKVSSITAQNKISDISDNLRTGVMSGKELSLLTEMVRSRSTAVQAAKNIWSSPKEKEEEKKTDA